MLDGKGLGIYHVVLTVSRLISVNTTIVWCWLSLDHIVQLNDCHTVVPSVSPMHLSLNVQSVYITFQHLFLAFRVVTYVYIPYIFITIVSSLLLFFFASYTLMSIKWVFSAVKFIHLLTWTPEINFHHPVWIVKVTMASVKNPNYSCFQLKAGPHGAFYWRALDYTFTREIFENCHWLCFSSSPSVAQQYTTVGFLHTSCLGT